MLLFGLLLYHMILTQMKSQEPCSTTERFWETWVLWGGGSASPRTHLSSGWGQGVNPEGRKKPQNSVFTLQNHSGFPREQKEAWRIRLSQKSWRMEKVFFPHNCLCCCLCYFLFENKCFALSHSQHMAPLVEWSVVCLPRSWADVAEGCRLWLRLWRASRPETPMTEWGYCRSDSLLNNQVFTPPKLHGASLPQFLCFILRCSF